jgi:hypothetical protein
VHTVVIEPTISGMHELGVGANNPLDSVGVFDYLSVKRRLSTLPCDGILACDDVLECSSNFVTYNNEIVTYNGNTITYEE